MSSMQLSTRTRQIQAQTLSPRLQRAVRMLQMSSLDFAALLRTHMDENPFLEEEDSFDFEGSENEKKSLSLQSRAKN